MKENITDAEVFAAAIAGAKFGSPLYSQLVQHFNEEMHKALKERINTPERMMKLYPIFREINEEAERVAAKEEYYENLHRIEDEMREIKDRLKNAR